MADPYIQITCKACGTLIVEFEKLTNDTFTTHSYRSTLEMPDAARQAAGVMIAVCSKCRGKTEFPAKYLPL
jgi:hypothetical protein